MAAADPVLFQKVNNQIKEFLAFNNYSSTLQCLEAEEKTKVFHYQQQMSKVTNIPHVIKPLQITNPKQQQLQPRLLKYFESDGSLLKITQKPPQMTVKGAQQKHQMILYQARQIFQIAVNCLQHLHSLKDGYASPDNLGEAIESYKISLGKYHKILLYELRESDGG